MIEVFKLKILRSILVWYRIMNNELYQVQKYAAALKVIQLGRRQWAGDVVTTISAENQKEVVHSGANLAPGGCALPRRMNVQRVLESPCS